MTHEPDLLTRERQHCRRLGFGGLFGWASLGLGLEAAHGFKWSPVLDDSLTRELLRLAHAHGVLLSLVCLAYAAEGLPLMAARPDAGRSLRRLLSCAWLLVPSGFALGALGHSESDPGLAIVLVPIGAVCLLTALAWVWIVSLRR